MHNVGLEWRNILENMKLKYLIILTIIATVTYYVYQDEALREKVMGKIHQVAPELNQSTLYKWQNNQGEWQVTDKPPGKGITFTTITAQDQINVMPSPPAKKKK